MPRNKRKRQTRLEFSPLPQSAPESQGYNQQIRDRAAAVSYKGADGSKKRKIVDFLEPHDPFTFSSSAASNGLVKSTASQASTSSLHDNITVNVRSDSEDDSLPDLPPAQKHKRTKKREAAEDRISSPVAPSTPKDTNFIRRHKSGSGSARRTGRRHAQKSALTDSDDDEPVVTSSTRKASDNFVDLGSDNEDSNESDAPRPSARKRRKIASSPITPQAEFSDDSDVAPQSTRRRLKGRSAKKAEATITLPSDSESAGSTPKAKSKGPSNTKTEEQQELEDDLKDLESSSSEQELPQSSQARAKSQRELALERLKRRRAGLSDEPKAAPEGMSEDDAEDSDEDEEMPMPSSSAKDMFAADEDDEGFLTDEGDDTLGAPDGVPQGVPLQFTRYASAKPKELFKFAIEWMVQKKLNPGFNRDDEIYNLTFSKLNDEVKGLAGSKFESAAWKTKFLFTLRARPQLVGSKMTKLDLAGSFGGKCEACNRSGHTPTYEVQFQGRPYHSSTLEDVDNGSDSDSDSDAAPAGTRDAQGHVIYPESHSFAVGRFCMANAEAAHALQHWKYHLYEWVVEYLQGQGYLASDKIVQRDGWGEPKRRKFANKVLDKMVDNGQVKKLYHDFKKEVERARETKQWVRGGSP